MYSFKNNIELLIQNNKTEEALISMLDAFKYRDKSLYSKLLILTAEYKEIKSDYNIGKIKYEEYRITIVRIQSAILETNNLVDSELNISKFKITNLPDKDYFFLSVSADYINDVMNLINDSGRKPYLNLILGMAGIGKTYLARKVALSYSINDEDRFNIIWFVNSESVESIISDLKELSGYFDIAFTGDIDAFLKKLKNALANTDISWLIIFDNACDKSSIEDNPQIFANKYFPKTEFPKQILVTSQNLDWYYIFNPKKHINLRKWDYQDYLQFFSQNNISSFTNEEIAFLYSELGGLPLAIAQTIAYIKKKNITVQKYIELLRINKEKLLNEKEISIEYKNSILNAILLSYEDLPFYSKYLLIIVSFFAPDNIPINLIHDKNKEFIDLYNKDNPFMDIFKLEKAKSELLLYSLAEQININTETISIHRLIKFSIQLYIHNSDTYISYLKESTKMLNNTFDIDISKIDVDGFEYFEILLPHILNVLANCEDNISNLNEELIDAAILSYKLGKYYNRLGNDNEALTKLLKANLFNKYDLEYFNEVLAARIDLQIGHIFYLTEERDIENKALPLFKNSYSIFIKHNLLRESTRCVNNIGSIYLMRRDYQNAILWYNSGIEISEEPFLYHNLGYVYQCFGEYDIAIDKYLKSLEISLQSHNLHRVGINYHLLGIIYGLKSDFDRQIEYHQKCLEIYRSMQQARRISYCLFQIINFSIDKKEEDEHLYNWYEEYQKYQDLVIDDSEYLLNSLVLKCRFALLNEDNSSIIDVLFSDILKQNDLLLSYPTDSHATSLYLDYAIYYYQKNDMLNAEIAIDECVNFIGNITYHRREELDNLLDEIKKSRY